MPSLQVCRPRPRRFRWRFRLLRGYGKLLSPPALLGLWVLAAGLSAFLPGVFIGHRVAVAAQIWEDQAHEMGKAVVKAWTQPLPPVAFTRGDEAEVGRWLEGDPLLHALVDPARGDVWLRDGRRLLKAGGAGNEESVRLLGWARQAQGSAQATWIPPSRENPRAVDESVLALSAGRRWQFKVWRPSSPETDLFLGRFMDSAAPFRFAITRYDRNPQAGRQNTESGALPPKSRFFPRVKAPLAYMFPDLSLAFGDPWVAGLWGTKAQADFMEHRVRTWTRMAWSAHAAFVTLLGLACLLHIYISRRDKLRADQLAFLAHSLKTPLTVLKLRCDTVRNANLAKEVQESLLARIGDEVDKLVKIIEAGLEGVRPEARPPVLEVIDAAFFLRLKEQMEPIFAGEGRALELEVEDLAFRASGQALQPALNTLLENALIHGAGATRVRVARRRNLVEILVCDEGPGIPPHKLSALATPGQGGAQAGQGVGIFLLRQMAVHEGWGLRFDSVGTGGFAAVLEIPA
ncbi:sensor histidine kinase KdpD [Geothrix sp. 21YS21S-2]|uniref:sensor histidine kinase n=1 Tax=Geothrix sp. 21YS21S-2 TaxID=3068893 RepID=UPI0027B995A0|nr:HAMP domain-containing sensor histidine kinase [Geothrix sp. 21YS21S-2]